VLPALLYLELDGNMATKAKEGAVEVPAPLELDLSLAVLGG
jgi:hypothetical protein